MGCCSPFSAVATRPTADPARHVNFTTGMVLGVDDYYQEFAYHSARDKWIVRDFLGYGTLSGLAVALEDDGANGPRVRVTAGSAAAPSGQLICVGRDQCGSLNAWLARPEIVEQLRQMTEETATPNAATLNLFLTLCYVDCAVADVPIPGEPCRSDENLMAPSRVADDYCLDFCFDPPPMAESMAIDVLTAFQGTLTFGGPNTPVAYNNALRRAELQLRLALGLTDPDDPAPGAGDLNPIQVPLAQKARFGAALKLLWVTRLRPFVMAQRCGAMDVPANDCVLLARLTVPVIKVDTHWEVEGPPMGEAFSVDLDESERPVLLAANIDQNAAGLAMESDGRAQQVMFLSATGPITISGGLVVVRSVAAATVTMPSAGVTSLGKTLTVKSAEAGVVTIGTPGGTTIDGANTLVLPVRGSASMMSDGAGTWHVTGMAG